MELTWILKIKKMLVFLAFIDIGYRDLYFEAFLQKFPGDVASNKT